MNKLKKGYPQLLQTTTSDLALLICAYMVDQHKWARSPNLHWGQVHIPAFQAGGWVLSLGGNTVTWSDITSRVAPKVASLREFIALIEEGPLMLGGELIYTDNQGIRLGQSVRVEWAKIEQIYLVLTKGVTVGEATLKKVVPEFIEVTSPELAVAAAAYMKMKYQFIRPPQLRGGDEELLKQTAGVTLRLANKEVRWHGPLGTNVQAYRARTLREFIGLVEDTPAPPKINVAGYDCEFKDKGVQIGCQFVPIEMVRTVLERKPQIVKT